MSIETLAVLESGQREYEGRRLVCLVVAMMVIYLFGSILKKRLVIRATPKATKNEKGK